MSPAQRLIVALDTACVGDALVLVRLLSPLVSTFKIGYALLFEPDLPRLYAALRDDQKAIFLDAKLNDIPATVQRGVASAARLGAAFLTVHANPAMLAAAMDGKGATAIKIMAVTALTSQPAAGTLFRAGLAHAARSGCDGVIMAPSDLRDPMFRTDRRWRRTPWLVATPGVRLAGTPLDEHARFGTPAQAIAEGADYVIVGRPILRAADPLAEAQRYVTALAPP